MITLGADTEQLRAQGQAYTASSSTLAGLLEMLQKGAQEVEWTGPDTDSFGRMVEQTVRNGLDVAKHLQDDGLPLGNEADQQDDASSTGSSSGLNGVRPRNQIAEPDKPVTVVGKGIRDGLSDVPGLIDDAADHARSPIDDLVEDGLDRLLPDDPRDLGQRALRCSGRFPTTSRWLMQLVRATSGAWRKISSGRSTGPSRIRQPGSPSRSAKPSEPSSPARAR